MKSIAYLETEIHNLLHRLHGHGLGEDVVAHAKKAASQLLEATKPMILGEARGLVEEAAAIAASQVGGGPEGVVVGALVENLLVKTEEDLIPKIEGALGSETPEGPTDSEPKGPEAGDPAQTQE